MTRQTDGRVGVVMFVMNDLLNDPRVQREARSAAQAGFRVRVVAVQSERCRVEQEIVDGYEVVRVRVPRRRVTYAAFGLFWWLLSFRWVLAKMALVLQEGAKLGLGLPSGLEAPGQAVGPASRLRRLKWGLMRGVGVLFFPLRVFRPWLGRVACFLKNGDAPGCAPAGLSERVRQRAHDLAFYEGVLWTTVAMLRAARDACAEVFHGNDLPTLPVTSWAARLAGGKALYDSHELWVGQSSDTTPFFNKVARWIESRYIYRMDAVVTVNHLIAEELCRQYKIALPAVVMNCPELRAPGPVQACQSIRSQLGLSMDTPLILYQGLYMPGRGLEALIESSRYLLEGVVVLRGYGSFEPELRRRVAMLPGTGRVFMVDPVPMADLVDSASEADVGVVAYAPCTPCNYYASPNKLFEYMLAGLAIAVSNLPVLEKIVRDHDLGVVFDPSDPRHIGDQLNALVGNPARLSACRENARRVAHDRYNWDHEGGKLMMLYRTLAEEVVSLGGSLDQ